MFEHAGTGDLSLRGATFTPYVVNARERGREPSTPVDVRERWRW